nr:hypothetical protein Iba_chr13cCG13600 [Ipomoea batatas]
MSPARRRSGNEFATLFTSFVREMLFSGLSLTATDSDSVARSKETGKRSLVLGEGMTTGREPPGQQLGLSVRSGRGSQDRASARTCDFPGTQHRSPGCPIQISLMLKRSEEVRSSIRSDDYACDIIELFRCWECLERSCKVWWMRRLEHNATPDTRCLVDGTRRRGGDGGLTSGSKRGGNIKIYQ